LLVTITATVLFIKNTSREKGDPWLALPDTPAIIIDVDNADALYKVFDENVEMKGTLGKIRFFKKLEIYRAKLDSLLIADQELYRAFREARVLTGIYHDEQRQRGILHVISTEKPYSPEKLKSFFEKRLGLPFAVVLKNDDGFDRLIVMDVKTDEKYIIGFADNLLLVSKNEQLVISGLKVYSDLFSANFTSQKEFSEIRKTAGKRVIMRVYYRNAALKELLANIVSGEYKKTLAFSGSLSKWTETDLIIRDNEIILNGMALGDSSEAIYQKLLGQKPQRLDLTSLMPYNTTIFAFEGFSDFEKWVADVNTKCGIVNTQKLIPLVGNEIAFVNTARVKKDFFRKSFLVVRVKDQDEVKKVLDASTVRKKVMVYDEYVVNKLKSGGFAAKLFGSLYGGITENYYTFIDDNLILANSTDELRNFLMFYETGKTLDLNENFKQFSENISESSNFTLFVRSGECLDVLTRYFDEDFAAELMTNREALRNFEGFSIQLSSQPPFIYAGGFIKYSKTQYEENLALWKVRLEDEIIRKPYPVKDHTTGNYNFLVFDKSNNVYLIRTDGTILWKKQLDGPPESDVHQIDYYKNSKIQYLFNTANKLYLIDRKGRYVKGYPVRISPSASNGLAVFDYNKRKDYRILLAQSDKRVYNYTVKGKKVKGWNAFKMPEIVVKPAQRLVANNKDYIIVTDLNKNLRIVNRRGERRIKLQGKFKIADHSIFYVNRTNRKGILITTDVTGKLVYISSSGKISYTDFGKFTANHFFLYEDFNGDGSMDFIFVDENRLRVFDRFKKVLFKYDFEHPVTIKPEFFNIGYRKKVLGIVVDREKTIYLFDRKGNVIISNGLVGEIPFTVVNSKNNSEINLITGAGKVLFNYRIK
jgi:hypothetical protein